MNTPAHRAVNATTGGSAIVPGHGEGHRRARRNGLPRFLLLLLGLTVLLGALGVVHLAQGTSGLGPADVVDALLGRADPTVAGIVLTTRVPRLLAGLVIGAALGTAGAALQILTRNPLASPDTLAINAGAFLTLTTAAAIGIPLGAVGGTAVAFAGGLVAAGITMALTRGGADPGRLVLGGSVLALALGSITSLLILLFSQETQGLFAWGSGTLSQSSPGPVLRVLPVVALGTGILLLLSPRLDVLGLGDDSARTLGIRVGRLRTLTVVCAVLLAAAAVSVVGPLGFVGLAAPAMVRLLRPVVLPLRLSVAFLLASAVAGALVSVGADVALRALLGAVGALDVPTGIATSLLGAVVMVAIAVGMTRRGSRGGSGGAHGAGSGGGAGGSNALGALLSSRRRFPAPVLVTTGVATAVLACALALLVGDATLLLGDVANWLRGVASPRIDLVLGSRWPRVGVAACAGGALALAGTLVQATTRNPLADPGLLGVSAGAGTGAILALLVVPGAGFGSIVAGALIGAFVAGGIVLGLGLRGGGDDSTRLVLVGLGVGTAALSLTTLVIVGTDPHNQAKALTWLAGSTYGASAPRVLVGALVLAVGLALSLLLAPSLDVTQLDPTTPRVLGVRVGMLRWTVLVIAVVLTATATAIVGVVAFVGLVAPHAARMLIGPRHRSLLVLATALGALLVVVADAAGRSLIAPAQLPAGTTTAVIGAPYFLYLLARSGGLIPQRKRR